MANEDEEIHNYSYICWICKEELNTYNIKDYTTVTGKFRGASHSICNKMLGYSKESTYYF